MISYAFFTSLLWLQAKLSGQPLRQPQVVFLFAIIVDFLARYFKRRRLRLAGNRKDLGGRIKGPEGEGIAMLAIDLDGTLLDDQSKVSEPTKKALQRFVSETNGIVVFATGQPQRPAKRTMEQLRDMNINCYFALSGGAVLVHGPSWSLRREFGIPMGLLPDIIQTVLREVPDYYLSVETFEHWLVSDDRYFRLVNDDMPGMGTKLKKLATMVPLDEVAHFLESRNYKGNVLRVLFIHESMKSSDAIRSLKGVVNTLSTKLNFPLELMDAGTTTSIEIHPRGVNKCHAVKYLCEDLGIEAGEVAAFGDQLNDLQLLEWAGTGIAMKNGNEILLKEANYVSEKSNNESGVAVEIEKLLSQSHVDALAVKNSAKLRQLTNKLEMRNSKLRDGLATLTVDIKRIGKESEDLLRV